MSQIGQQKSTSPFHTLLNSLNNLYTGNIKLLQNAYRLQTKKKSILKDELQKSTSDNAIAGNAMRCYHECLGAILL